MVTIAEGIFIILSLYYKKKLIRKKKYIKKTRNFRSSYIDNAIVYRNVIHIYCTNYLFIIYYNFNTYKYIIYRYIIYI